ncbi:MAG: anaerobic ribonucleoside-triphosphate reductase activating protein [bacterium]
MITIKGFIEMSMLDWEGKLVSTLYLPHCNLRCLYCHNSGLVLNPEQYNTISFETVKNYLIGQQDWIDGVCLSGGEPCMYEDLPDFIRQLRDIGVLIKLDTNGSFPDMLQRLLNERLIDYIAMDIKSPLDTYAQMTGINDEKIGERIKQSIRIVMDSRVGYEFRTTVVPSLHTKEILMTMAESVSGAKKYVLQAFVPDNALDPEYLKIIPYTNDQMKDIQQTVSPYVQKCVLRGV